MTQTNVGGMVTNVQTSWKAGAMPRRNGNPQTPKQEETAAPPLKKNIKPATANYG
jgi:hypothetical protein